MPRTAASRPPPAAAASADVETCFALMTSDEGGARAAFARCHDVAEQRDDAATRRLCAAGMILTIAIEYADFRGLDLWVARFRTGACSRANEPQTLNDARIDAASLFLPSLVQTLPEEDASRPAGAARLHAFLLGAGAGDEAIGAEERVLLGKVMVDSLAQQHDALAIGRLAALMQEHLQSAPVSPAWHVRWWLVMLINHEYFGNTAGAQVAQERAEALVERHGLPAFRFALACIKMRKVLAEDDLVEADRLSRVLEDLLPQVRVGIVPHGLRAQALVLMRRGRWHEALHKIDLVLAICADVAVPMRDRGAYVMLRAYCLFATGQTDAALGAMAEVREHQTGVQRDVLDAIVAAAVAALALEAGRDDARALVAAAVGACARLDYDRFLYMLPQWASRVAEAALDDGIEVDFVRKAIRQQRLRPADPAREDWPWRLQVHALGTLRVLRDGEPVKMAGKAQKKPLELLALLAAQGGRPIAIEAVIDQLWPSLEANAPRASFDMAVSRLRKLLDVGDAVRVAEGSVSLDPALAWTDVAAFERLWERLAGGESSAELAERAIAIYRDRLLGNEDVIGLVYAARERLAMAFTRVVEQQGARLEAAGDWRAATLLYERGLSRDTLAEPLYRALMRAHLQLGERAEALRTYRRCRQLLSAVLGAEPSARTSALASAAMHGEP